VVGASVGMMNQVAHFVWLAGQAASALPHTWVITMMLGILITCAVCWDLWKARLKLEPRLPYLLLPILSVVLILLVGSWLERQPDLVYLAHVGFGVGIVAAVVPVFLLKPAWATAMSIFLFALWCSFWCWCVSVMSITGEWHMSLEGKRLFDTHEPVLLTCASDRTR